MIEHSSGQGHGFVQIFNYIGIQREIIDELFASVFATEDQAQLNLHDTSWLLPNLVSHHLELKLRASKGPIAHFGAVIKKLLGKNTQDSGNGG